MICRGQITLDLPLTRVPGRARERKDERAANEGRGRQAIEMLRLTRSQVGWEAGITGYAQRAPSGQNSYCPVLLGRGLKGRL